MESSKKELKTSYRITAVIKRMLKNMWRQDRKQFGRIAVYTMAAAIYPFMGVVLPKLAIGILEQGGEAAIRNLFLTMGGYFVVSGILVTLVKYLDAYIQTRNMRLRLRYLGLLSDRLQTIDYCHHEDALFFEKYQKGMNAGNNNANGIEGLYNKISQLPAKFLTLTGMVIMAGALSPLLLIALAVHVIVIMWTSKLTHDYEYSKKEETSKAWRRIDYYQRTTLDFSHGKDIRIFNLRQRIMDNYQAEIDAYVKLFTDIKNREFLLGLCGIVTLFISNVLTYGILIQNVMDGMSVSSFSMYTAMVVALMALMLDFGRDLAFIHNEGEYVNDFFRFMDEPLVAEGEKVAEAVLNSTNVMDTINTTEYVHNVISVEHVRNATNVEYAFNSTGVECLSAATNAEDTLDITSERRALDAENVKRTRYTANEERTFKAVNKKHASTTTDVEQKTNLQKASPALEIVFDHVTFRYPGTEKNIFTDLNFTIHSGERLAIVGINGAGKSTLVKLMTGLFAPTEGHIYINGVDITSLKKSELYSLYSAVFQEVNVLAFTIRENVACASEGVDDGRVKEALEKVGLWSKVEGLKNGLDQMMLKVIDENGTDFSGGERQKLSIARGLYKDAAMVIMDEPTAALDALAEAEIYENFSSLVEGKTAVYISHRLASTRFCDKIALFDADGLAEYGNHEELMALKGKYYDMFMIQGKYYQNGDQL